MISIINRRYIGFVFSLFIAFQSVSFGQKLSVETSIDTNRITLGDQINLNYFIEKKNDLLIILPIISDTLTAGVEVLGDPEIDSAKIDDDTWRIKYGLLITSFDTGIYFIPPQPIFYSDEFVSDTLYTRPTYLEVIGVAIDTTNTVRDIKSQAKMPLSLLEILSYLIPLLIIAIIVYVIIVYLLPKKKAESDLKPSRAEEPPYITALRELDKIKVQKLWQQKQIKEYYTRITHVVRWYIERRFLINALEQTSDEILDHIQSQKLDDINYVNLANLLNLADLVKFAKGEPDPEANYVHLENAYDFIKMTRVKSGDTEFENNIEENN